METVALIVGVAVVALYLRKHAGTTTLQAKGAAGNPAVSGPNAFDGAPHTSGGPGPNPVAPPIQSSNPYAAVGGLFGGIGSFFKGTSGSGGGNSPAPTPAGADNYAGDPNGFTGEVGAEDYTSTGGGGAGSAPYGSYYDEQQSLQQYDDTVADMGIKDPYSDGGSASGEGLD